MPNPRRFSAWLFFLVIVASLSLVSGAPFRVWAADVVSFSVAFLVPALIMAHREWKKAIVWLLGFGLAGILIFDISTSIVIVKREFLMGWHVLYPVGIVALLGLHAVSRFAAAGYQKMRDMKAL